MKLWDNALFLALFVFVLPVRADLVLGAIGIEPDTPIAGEEDIVIFDLTGPTDGCSTPGGTPVCTAVSFDNLVLTINGTTQLSVGNVDPGITETYPLAGGVFVDGSITSLAFSADLSTTVLTDDLANTYHVDSPILLSGLPTDGTLADIDATLASTVPTPEPDLLPLLVPLLLSGLVLIRRVKRLS
jgi:hypothetical protein